MAVDKANLVHRRRALFWLLVLSLPLLALMAQLDHLPQWLGDSSASFELQVRWLVALLVLLSLPLAIPLVLLWRLAERTRIATRFPPPGTLLLRDTPVREGRAALRYARLLKLLTVLLALAIGAIPVALLLMLRAITGS